MAGNMQPVRISAAGLFTFRLKKGSTVLLEEDYVPDASGQAEIDIRDLVLSDLSLSLPSADVFKQTAAAASYTISTDTDSRTFKAVLGGIDRPATDAATFLGTNFLTWQPQLKSVTYGQPEWLSFYTPAAAVSLKAKFYLKDGTTYTVTVAASFDPGCVYSVNVRFSRLWSMGEGDRYGMVDVWLEDDQDTALTYVQRYVLDTSGDERTVLVARNSLGGIDTFSFLGSMERSAEAEHTNVMRGETMFSGLVDMTRTYTVNTGILSGHGRDWVWDLQRSPQAWVLMDGALRGIVMLAPAVTASMYEDSTGTVDFLLCDDSGYLNMPRLESLPEDIEVPGPDGEVFFLAPRLADYPDASLGDSLLLPVQSPAAQEWSKLSVAALSSYILSAVDDKYGEFLHVHENLPVLGKLSVDDNGRLMYDGSPVGGSGLTEHDHHGETIRPEKIVVGTVEITCVDGRLHVSSTITSDGDFVAFGDEAGGETGGGLDVARLWEELVAADASKVIDVSHIPGSVVLQDELTEILDDYPLTTEMNTALGGKADKDWVEEELAKYVTLSTDQNVTGVKTFTNGIKIGGVTLSTMDGRLHVSSTVTSDGDFVAFGDEEGGTAGGGLDVARLWEELEAEGTEQIHASHLSDALTGYATQSDLDGRINDLINGAPAAYDTLKEIADVLEGNVDSIGDILTALGGKADKATTLEGYGITDAYTDAEVDSLLADYVTLAGSQNVTGVKTFTNGIKIGTVGITCVNGRLHFSATATSDGDFVAFGDEEGSGGSGGLDVERMWEELEADDSSKVIDVSHIPALVSLAGNLPWSRISGIPSWIGSSKPSYTWSEIGGKPTTFTPAAHNHPLSQISGLNSSWAALLEEAPSDCVIRWPEISEVTRLQDVLASKWEWNASQIAGVKVNNAVAADKLASSVKINGTDFNGESDIVTVRWGSARTVTVWDFYNVNKQAAQGVDGSADFSLMLPQSIKVKTLNIDGVTLSVVGGRLHVDSTLTADGDLVAYGDGEGSSGGGLDEEAMWAALGGSMSSKVVSASHLPSLSSLSGNLDSSRITGLDSALASYATKEWVEGKGYLTSVSLATISDLNSEWDALLKAAPSAYVTRWPTASEVGALTQSAADGRYVNKSGDTMSGNLIVSGAAVYRKMSNDTSSAATVIGWKKAADDTTLASVGYFNVRKAIYINSHTNETSDLFSDAVGKYTLFIGVNDLTYNTYPILRSDNIGSYALTPSNYTSTLDSRYVKKAGDTMTGVLQFPDNVAATGQPTIKFGTLGQIGCDKGFGSWLQYNNNYIHVTDAGPRYNNTYTIWHSGNDGSGSGLDADTVDGTHSYNLFITNAGGLSSSQLDTFVNRQSGTYNVSYSGHSRTLTVFRGIGSSSAIELLSHYGGQLWCRWTIDSNRYNEIGFREFAFTDSNVASATKLATARSLWGNSFDGGQDITGKIYAYNGISAPYGPGMWIDMARRADVIMADRNNSTQSAHVLYRAKDSNGNAIVFGGLGVNIGFYGFTASRISSATNGTDWSTVWNVGTGSLSHSGSLSVAGQLTAGGNVIAYSSSSRLVKDILPAVSYSRRLKSLGRVVEYRYNGLIERDRDIHTGLLYENVRDIMPSMCFMHEGYGALNYLDKDYICTIAGAVQENIDDIAYLKNRVASLEAEVERLRRGLAA